MNWKALVHDKEIELAQWLWKTYVEPFAGSGAPSLHLARNKELKYWMIKTKIWSIHASLSNRHLCRIITQIGECLTLMTRNLPKSMNHEKYQWKTVSWFNKINDAKGKAYSKARKCVSEEAENYWQNQKVMSKNSLCLGVMKVNGCCCATYTWVKGILQDTGSIKVENVNGQTCNNSLWGNQRTQILVCKQSSIYESQLDWNNDSITWVSETSSSCNSYENIISKQLSMLSYELNVDTCSCVEFID